MVNTITGGAGETLSHSERAAARTARKSTHHTIKLVLVWVVVGLPMAWGVMKAVEEVKYLFQ
jgi:hypothetical protein